jgi:peptidylprolyl isomerase
MHLKKTLFAGAVALLLNQGAWAADPIASADGVQITEADFLQTLKDANVNPAQIPPQQVENFLRNELARRVIITEAKKAGTDKVPETQRAMARAAEAELIKEFLAQQSMPPATYPTETDIQAAFTENQGKLVVPKRYHLARIFLAAGDDAVKKRAVALAADLKAHPDGFAASAAKNSQDQTTAQRGGDIGWVPAQNLEPDVQKAVDGLQKGQVSGVITGKTGFYIVKMLERTEERPATLDEVRPDLTRALRQQKARELEQAYIQKLDSTYPASITQGEVAKISAQPTAVTSPAAPAPK